MTEFWTCLVIRSCIVYYVMSLFYRDYDQFPVRYNHYYYLLLRRWRYQWWWRLLLILLLLIGCMITDVILIYIIVWTNTRITHWRLCWLNKYLVKQRVLWRFQLINYCHYPGTEEVFHSIVGSPDMFFVQIHSLTRIPDCNWKSM